MKHEIHVKHILQKLQETDLQVDIIKCEFHVMKVVYFNFIIINLWSMEQNYVQTATGSRKLDRPVGSPRDLQ